MNRILHFFSLLIFLFSMVGCDKDKDWELTWSEEFDYIGRPHEAFWGYETGYVRNRELQYYTDQPQNAKVENGYCTIQAKFEAEDSITSASINTLHKIDFLYGRVEVRAKIPSALGSWPAIWMLGINKVGARMASLWRN